MKKVLFAAAMTIVAASSIWAQSDTAPPAITSVQASALTVTTGPQAVDVTFQVGFLDDLSGVRLLEILLESPTSGAITVNGGANAENGDLISGTVLNGTMRAVVTFPAYAAAGSWPIVRIRLTDRSGNAATLLQSEIGRRGFPTAINVVVGTQTSGGGSAGATTSYTFPQFVDGRFSDGTSYRTSVFLINNNSVAAATCTLQLYGMKADFAVDGAILAGATSINLDIKAAAAFSLARTSGVRAFERGFAVIRCSDPNIRPVIYYSLYAPSGEKVSEATVFSINSPGRARFVADQTGGSRVGIALANDGTDTRSFAITISDQRGAVLANQTVQVSASGSFAKFVDELFPSQAGWNGTTVLVEIKALDNSNFAVVGSRFTGFAFTLLPPS